MGATLRILRTPKRCGPQCAPYVLVVKPVGEEPVERDKPSRFRNKKDSVLQPVLLPRTPAGLETAMHVILVQMRLRESAAAQLRSAANQPCLGPPPEVCPPSSSEQHGLPTIHLKGQCDGGCIRGSMMVELQHEGEQKVQGGDLLPRDSTGMGDTRRTTG